MAVRLSLMSHVETSERQLHAGFPLHTQPHHQTSDWRGTEEAGWRLNLKARRDGVSLGPLGQLRGRQPLPRWPTQRPGTSGY